MSKRYTAYRAAVLFFVTFLSFKANAQISLNANSYSTETFNSIGNSPTASLPTNWKMSSAGTGLTSGWTASTNVTATTIAANSGTPATGGRYNWATTAGIDRSIGFLNSASYGSPNAIMAHYRNATGSSISSLTVAYSIERYLVNSAVPTVDLYYSTEGSTWTLVSGASTLAGDFPSGAVAGSFSTPKTIIRTTNVNVALTNNADIYFKWVFISANTNGQGLGLDNVSVYAGSPTPVVIATLQDLLQVDNGVQNQFNEGDVITYKTVVKNTGTGDANNVQITLPTPPGNTTMVAGSIKTSAVAVDDSYNVSFNTALSVSAVGSGVLNNDVGIPTPTAVLSYGTTADATVFAPGVVGTTDAGGTISLNANGTFTYTPPTDFSGVDRFKYITGNGNLPNNDAIVIFNVAGDITLSATPTDPFCNNGTNGRIVINASGGNGTLEYSINGAGGPYQASNTFTSLSPGTYNLAVRDADGYIKTGTTTINNPAAIVVNGTIPTLTYATAMSATTFAKTGGSGATTWSATGLPNGVSINNTNGQVTGTPTITGIFNANITATDVNGCTGSLNVALNVVPKLSADNYTFVGNTQLVSDAHSTPATPHTISVTNILGNDQSDAAITVTAVTNAATTGGGIITIDATGKFTYSPAAGNAAADTYTYTATSNGVSATATITLSSTGMVWYVNNTYGGANGAANGTSHRPFTTVNAAASASAINQIIYVHTGTGNTSGDALLKPGQTLRGAGSALSLGTLSIAAGTKPTLTGMITLANSVTVDGFDMSTGSVTALTNAGSTVTGVIVNVGNVITTTGIGLNIIGTGNNVSITLASLTTNGALNAVNLTGTAGTVTINGGSLTGGMGAVVNINGGTVSITYSGSASQGAAAQPLVSVTNGHNSGTILFQTGTLSATNGIGLQFDNADGTYNFNGTTTLSGGDAAIDIVNGSGGNFSFSSNTAITNPSGSVLTIDNSTAGNITYSGSFSKTNAGIGISINNKTGGTISINGTGTKTLSTSTGNAINLTNNTGATINFSGNNLLLTTTSGVGLNATGGGTINVSGTGNIINSGIGTALNVNAATIGGIGITFQSISASGGINGIVLNNTGASGGLTVTGDVGSANNSSGGTIQNTTGDGISLTNTRNISLDQMNIQGADANGINGTLVTNFTFTNGTINNSGDNLEESAIAFNLNKTTANNLSGTLTVTGSTLTNSYYSGLDVQGGAGTITNANISNNVITGTTSGMGINFAGSGTPTTAFKLENAIINQNNIQNTRGAGVQVQATSDLTGTQSGVIGIPGDPTKVISITNNSIWNLNPNGTHAISVATGSSNPSARTKANFIIQCNGKNTGGCTAPTANPIGSSNIGTVVLIGNNGNSDMVGIVNNNAIAATHTVGGGAGNGIGGGNGVSSTGNTVTPDLTLSVTNNTISGTDGNGILLVGRGTSGIAKLKIASNTVGTPLSGTRPGIRVDAGNASSADDAVCVEISANTSGGSGGSAGIGVRKQGTNATVNDFGVKGLAGGNCASVENYISSLNPGSVLGTAGCQGSSRVIVISGDNYVSCSTSPN